MPVRVEKRGDSYRVVEVETGHIAATQHGKPRDGGGHKTKAKAEAQARAINSSILKG